MQPLLLLLLNLEMTFLVHDFAQVKPEQLSATMGELSRLLEPVPVEVRWVVCISGSRRLNEERCQHPERGDVFLRFLSSESPQPAGAGPDVLGLIEADWARRGLISVWPGRVEELRRGTIWSLTGLLARVIGHEVGHLAGLAEGPGAGLTSSSWRKVHLSRITPHGLSFTAAQAASMQEPLRSRFTRPQAATELARQGR